MSKEKGFTLVEVIVVVGLLGLLASIAVPNYLNYLHSSRVNTDIATARTLAVSAKVYCGTHGITEIPEDFSANELNMTKKPETAAEDGKYEYFMSNNDVYVSFVASGQKAGKYGGYYEVSASGDLPHPVVGGMESRNQT